jgi:hypothetical protein
VGCFLSGCCFGHPTDAAWGRGFLPILPRVRRPWPWRPSAESTTWRCIRAALFSLKGLTIFTALMVLQPRLTNGATFGLLLVL